MDIKITWSNWNEYREVWKRGKKASDRHTHVKYVVVKNSVEDKVFTTTPLSTTIIGKTITIK